jgi:hypothetical protein
MVVAIILASLFVIGGVVFYFTKLRTPKNNGGGGSIASNTAPGLDKFVDNMQTGTTIDDKPNWSTDSGGELRKDF